MRIYKTLIQPIVIPNGSLYWRHTVIEPLELWHDDTPPKLTPIDICELKIDSKTGMSAVCPHKKYARWEYLP